MTRVSCLALVLAAGPAWAEVPTVLADTAPIHSLVAMVTGDLGSPSLIVPQGTSPHDASLTPSEAQALTKADLIVWTGDAFLPWLGETIGSLAADTPTLALLETDGWEPLPARGEAHLHDEDEHGHGEHAHEDEEHAHEAHGDDEHAHEEHTGEEPVEGNMDPHAWLDPAVAAAWLPHIADAFADVDPENADTYRANAAAGAERLTALRADMVARLAPLAGQGYAVGHDAYQYLEHAAGLPASWTIAHADGAEPAPGDVADLRDAVLAGEVGCLLLDAETDPAWAETLGEGATLRTAQVDPDGVFLEPGPSLYPAMMEALTAALETCLSSKE